MMQGDISNQKGTCKRGFFVLRLCDKPAIGTCALSQRAICEDCAIEQDGQLVCREEFAKVLKSRGITYDYDEEKDFYDMDDPVIWYYFIRDDFYDNQSYEPFTDYDSGGFDESNEFGGGEFGGAGASGAWDDGTGKASFYDS